MNFLAHLYLSADEPEAMVGNLAADFVKGADVERLPSGVRAGIRQHRTVDAFTDRHAVVMRSISRIGKTWGWFSGIIVDVYYDHVLALDWRRYAKVPLRTFADQVHRVIRDHAEFMPEEAREYALRFVEADRLMSYSVPDGSGVAEALRRLSDRIAARMPRRAVRLHEAMPDLRAAHRELAADFHEFFPDAVRLAAEWRTPSDSEGMTLTPSLPLGVRPERPGEQAT
jgi:acyl carrier protein phosphodiesterase